MCPNLRNNISPKFEILKPFAYKLYVLDQKPSAYFFFPFEIYPKTLSFLKSDRWIKFRNDHHGNSMVRRYGMIKNNHNDLRIFDKGESIWGWGVYYKIG